MTTDFTLISYLNDLKLSTRLVKISQQNGYQLVFPTADEPLKQADSEKKGLVIIDVDDPEFTVDGVIREVRRSTTFPIIGVVDHIRRSWRDKAAKNYFDLIIPKSLLEQNLAVVIRQLQYGG